MAESRTPTVTTAQEQRPATILVVDDNPVNLVVLESMLEPNYNVIQAGSGIETLKTVRDHDIDLILLDIAMPSMDGYEVCRRLKQDDATRDLPVIFLTAAESMGSELTGLSLGAVDYLTKPVQEAILLARVNNHLELAKARKNLAHANEILETCVRKRTELLDKANLELQAQIKQHELTLNFLETTVADLDAANRVKAEFLSIMSHELRTPLNGIIGMTDLAKMVSADPEQISFLDTVLQSANALRRLVDRMMEYVDLESGKKTCGAIPYDLKEIIRLVIDNHQSQATQKSLQLQQDIGPEVPAELRGDPPLLKSILDELIENAIDFTSTGKVTISVTCDALPNGSRQIHFSVRDTGCGIQSEGLARLFKPFQQLDSSATRKHEGIGLGLALSKQRINLLGGEIWVESQPAQGSDFQFSIPLATA